MMMITAEYGRHIVLAMLYRDLRDASRTKAMTIKFQKKTPRERADNPEVSVPIMIFFFFLEI